MSVAVSNAPLPPGPKGGLLLGVMPEFNRDALGFVTRLAREYGDVVRSRFLHVTVYFLNHPDLVEELLVTRNKNFRKASVVRSPFFQRVLGNGLVTSEGDFWLRQRRLAQPAFHRERIGAYADVMVAYTERLLGEWRDGEERDAHRDMMRLTLEVVSKCLFDADVAAEAADVGEAMRAVVKPFASQATLKWIADNRLPTPGHRRFHAAMRRIDEVVYRIIEERRREGSSDRGDLLSMLLRAQDEDGSRMTDRQLRDETMTLFLAGHDTTAITLSWAWYLLARHPEAEAALWRELEEVLDGGRSATAEDVPRLRYAEQVVKEAMRLYPPAWGIGREALRDCELGGFRVPRGTQLFAFPWVIQRDPRFFDAPEEFRPERWTEAAARGLPRFAYFPFGGGPRACIGNNFAMMEAVLVLATVARRFQLTLVPGQKVEPYPALTLRPREGLKVIVKKR